MNGQNWLKFCMEEGIRTPKKLIERFFENIHFSDFMGKCHSEGYLFQGKSSKKVPHIMTFVHKVRKNENSQKSSLLVFLESEYLPPCKFSASSDHSFLTSILFSVFWENGLWRWKTRFFAIFRRFRPRKHPKIWVSQNILQNPIKTYGNTLYWEFWVSLGLFLAF